MIKLTKCNFLLTCCGFLLSYSSLASYPYCKDLPTNSTQNCYTTDQSGKKVFTTYNSYQKLYASNEADGTSDVNDGLVGGVNGIDWNSPDNKAILAGMPGRQPQNKANPEIVQDDDDGTSDINDGIVGGINSIDWNSAENQEILANMPGRKVDPKQPKTGIPGIDDADQRSPASVTSVKKEVGADQPGDAKDKKHPDSKFVPPEKSQSFMDSVAAMGTADDAGYGDGSNQVPFNYPSTQAVSYTKCRKVFGQGKYSLETLKSKFAALQKDQIEPGYECIVLTAAMSGADVLEDPSEYAKEDKKSSMDGKIKCKTNGLTTLDYPSCSKAITAYNSFLIATQALVEYQKVTLAAHQIDLQAQIKPENPVGSLEAQKSVILKQREQLQTLTAVQAAKGATLFAMVRNIPIANSIVQHCAQKNPKSVLQNVDIPDNTQQDSILNAQDNQTACLTVVLQNNMAMNGGAVDQFKYAIAQAGIEVAKNMVVAKLLKDRANQIDNLIAKFKKHDPSKTVAFLPAELAKFCQLNPTDPRCSAGLPQGASQFGSAGFNIDLGSNGAATTFDNNPEQTGNDGHEAEDLATAADPGADISPGFAATANKGGGFSGASVGAAALKSGRVSSGGGGGGAPGGVGAPSGGDIRTGKGNYQSYSKVKMKKLAYGGGSSKSLYSGSRRSRRTKKKSPVGNPFSKLFGKKNSNRLNFRSLASKQIPKNGRSLFERITKRYSSVNKQNRLMVYDEVK